MGNNLALLVTRLAIGSMMLFAHGWPKLANFATYAERFPDPIGFGSSVSLALAVFAEVFCSVAIMAGFLTRLAALPLLCTMLVAAFIVHANDPWAKQEFALLYAVPFFTLMLTGGGKWALDSFLPFTKKIA